MRPAISPIRLLLLASTLALVLSCGDRARIPPPANLNPPANLLTHRDSPPIPAEAATSEKAYESWRDDKDDWGEENAGIIDRACWWLFDAGVTALTCRPRTTPNPQ